MADCAGAHAPDDEAKAVMNTGPTLPGGWTIRSLRSCLRTAPEYGINAAAVPFEAGLPAYLRITDISDDNRFRPSPRVSIKHPDATEYFLKEGDLVFARTGASVGKSYLYNPDDGPLVFAGFLIRVSPNPEDVQPVFLAYCAQSERYWDWVATMSIRSGQPGINGQEYGTFQLLLPSSDEQRAVAEALSDVDGLIESLESLIDKKRAVKTAAVQQLLTGKTRLPGFHGEWKTKRLGEIANIDPENLSDDTNPDYEFNYISLEQVETGKLHGYTDETFRSSPSRARRKLRHNDVLMATVRPNLMGHLLFNEQFADTVCSTGFAVLRCKDSLSVPEFLFVHLLGSVVNKQIEAVLAGSNYPAISSCDVALVEIPCPPTVREQVAIGTILSDMDAEIAALGCRLDKGRALKQGMVQQLLTGKIRLVDPA